MKCFVKKYFQISLVYRLLFAFVLGGILGILGFKFLSIEHLNTALSIARPFGVILTALLKMMVVPIIFFSLIVGASTLPLKKSGKLGASVMIWYFATSMFATIFGIFMAFVLNPNLERNVSDVAGADVIEVANKMVENQSQDKISEFLSSMFVNPFQALSTNNFLAIVVFSVIFGLAARVLLDKEDTSDQLRSSLESTINLFSGISNVFFKMIEWIMEYFPIGVLALTFQCFAENGPKLMGTYLGIAGCVIFCVMAMVFFVYPLAILVVCRENPYKIMNRIKTPIITAFVTRSSAATLPVSMQTAESIGIEKNFYSFSLPLGATINMDGVCVHLPVFAILAANMYGMQLTFGQLIVLLISVVFASIGAGGVPGGSLLLLFMVLENMGLSTAQSAPIVALALGINPILDMFETACNVAGDNVCTYIVAKKNDMI
ncbi:MAG: dicarboxylate/amino acid:cation symporter [Planctomycetes bacterium]|nr:dicarboxylate/amino acid:cation symporter [Planctomycetota bacterium]